MSASLGTFHQRPKGDVIALGGPTSALTDKMGLIGPEVADQNALNVPLDQADILVTNKKYIGRALETFRQEPVAGQVQLVRYERGGVPFPAGLKTTLQRMDILSVVGLNALTLWASKARWWRSRCFD